MRDQFTRRHFLRTTAAAATGTLLYQGQRSTACADPPRGKRPVQAKEVTVLNPQDKVPISFIIDDSTCLVNLAHFKIPQLGSVRPDQYPQDWRALPREIPDSFVRQFAGWCHEHGVKGKYSVVPYPACVGWIDRFMPGWTRRELEQSLELVRDTITIDWDIHPEMISHTWAIDTKTGRPYAERTDDYLENFGFSVGKSADFLADYMAYALRLLKNAGLPCEGVTTPGGFGNRSLEALSLGALEAVRDVYGAEIPHYFRHMFTDDRSVVPRVENVSGLGSADPRCVVSIIGCTGDWFGGWDGLMTEGSADQFITEDLQRGRMPEIIARQEPAIMVCHWPGIYFNGQERGFNIFKEVVGRLHARYDNLLWMKLSEIARYWAARELTAMDYRPEGLVLSAPFAAPDFTLRIPRTSDRVPMVVTGQKRTALRVVTDQQRLSSGTCARDESSITLCLDLQKGKSVIAL